MLLIALTLCGCDLTEGYPTPTDRFFVNDFADIISDEYENEIYNDAANLYNKTTAQVVVITVDDLNGEEIADYALNIGREWGVGMKRKITELLFFFPVMTVRFISLWVTDLRVLCPTVKPAA